MTITNTELTTDSSEDLTTQTAEALDAVQEILDTYIVFPSDEARDAVVLWAAHAHVYYVFESTPRLSVCSNEPGSGKSRVLEILQELTPNPLFGINISPGVLWHAIDQNPPTLLFDEVDTLFGKKGSSSAYTQLRAIINGGHRASGRVPRLVGRGGDVQNFKVFSPVAMAGIGHLPETVRTRSVEIRMRKRKPSEHVEPFRLKFAQYSLRHAFDLLREWSDDAETDLRMANPELPVQDRDADVWEPLIAIGDLAGAEWAERARKACRTLTNDSATVETPAVRLLRTIRQAFGEQQTIFTSTLLDALNDHPDNPFPNLRPKTLGHILREFDVSPTTVRVPGSEDPAKGYRRADFEKPWKEHVTDERDA